MSHNSDRNCETATARKVRFVSLSHAILRKKRIIIVRCELAIARKKVYTNTSILKGSKKKGSGNPFLCYVKHIYIHIYSWLHIPENNDSIHYVYYIKWKLVITILSHFAISI